MDNYTEKTLSNLVETMFPQFYQTDGPTFIEFVKTYYEWLEGSQEVAVPFTKGSVAFRAGNNVVTGNNTFFVDQFSAGDKIGLFYDSSDENYEIFTINSISSDTSLTLSDTAPAFTSNNSLYGNVKVEYNPNYHIRRLNDYSDVDTTTDEFILFFKEKYLKNIQFTTKTNTRQLIKHSLDLYRSKGTPRGLELLFRLVFGTSVKVYYPGTDVFKPSDGVWYVPRYLEVSLKDSTTSFVNQQIIGLSSGATAFVESVVRRNIKGKFIDLVYISSINGSFVTDELINLASNPVSVDDAPTVTGSLQSIDIDIDGTASGYEVGDLVDVYSAKGEGAIARVANVSTITGIVKFELVGGGYGYEANSEIAISERVLQLQNITLDPTNTGQYFGFAEQVYQPLANIAYTGATGSFTIDTVLLAYNANNAIISNGQILGISAINSTAGTLLVGLNGNVALNSSGGNKICTVGNSVVANISVYSDVTAVGNVVGYGGNTILNVQGANSAAFRVGEVVYQFNSNTLTDSGNGVIGVFTAGFGSNAVIRLVNCHGVFDSSVPVMTKNGNVSANIVSVGINLGVKDIVNDFYAYDGNRLYGNTYLTDCNVGIVSSGFGASFDLSNSFNYTEDVLVDNDFLSAFSGVLLNANAYGFTGNATANLGTVMDDALSKSLHTFGKLTAIKGQAVGADYNLAPIVRVYDAASARYNIKDIVLTIENASGLFKVGELITQAGSNARGLVTAASLNQVYAENLRVNPDNAFITTVNATSQVVGTDTSVTANVSAVAFQETSQPIGLNANIDAMTQTANGSVTELQPIDSGFGFVEGETINFKNANNNIEGLGVARLGHAGKSKGFYKQKGGFLSSDKKLFDGLYYQDYSYEIRSSVTLDRYEEMLKKIMHIPGTKYFGALVYDTVNDTAINSLPTTISQV